MLKTGIKGLSNSIVKYEETAASMGNGELAVFSTPNMIGMMELTCKDSVEEYLEKGQGTVGVRVDIQHLGATPVDMKITCTSELIEIKGAKLTFKVECHDEIELVGKGIHERFIVDSEKFMKKLSSKLEK